MLTIYFPTSQLKPPKIGAPPFPLSTNQTTKKTTFFLEGLRSEMLATKQHGVPLTHHPQAMLRWKQNVSSHCTHDRTKLYQPLQKRWGWAIAPASVASTKGAPDATANIRSKPTAKTRSSVSAFHHSTSMGLAIQLVREECPFPCPSGKASAAPSSAWLLLLWTTVLR